MIQTALNDPAAAAAFLRGIERRAALLAELQCGDPGIGDRTLAQAMALFSDQVATSGFSHWPYLFWSTLLAQPALEDAGVRGRWAEPFTALAAMPVGPRVALLLRLVAGLQEEAAAAALGISVEVYQDALAEACPRDAAGNVDAAAWTMLGRGAQDAVRALPAERLQRIAALRDSALAGRLSPQPPRVLPGSDVAATVPVARDAPHEPANTTTAAPIASPRAAVDSPARQGAYKRLSWAALAIAVVVIALRLIWPHLPSYRVPGSDEQVLMDELPRASAARTRFDADFALLTEPDLELLLYAPAPDALDRMALYAWYAAEREGVLPKRPQPPADHSVTRNPLPMQETEPPESESEDAP